MLRFPNLTLPMPLLKANGKLIHLSVDGRLSEKAELLIYLVKGMETTDSLGSLG